MPIYQNGSLQYFADVRAANLGLASFFQRFDASINQQIAASVPETEGGSSSGDTPEPPLAPIAGAAAAFNLDLCFKVGVG